MAETCETCRFWSRGYLLWGKKVPSSCDRYFHPQAGEDPACKDHQPKGGEQ